MADNDETRGQNPSGQSTSSATVATDGNDNGNRQQRATAVSRSKEDLEDDSSSPSKKQRLEVEKEDYNLEERLNNILRCSRCQDLPSPTVYQCANGHLLCIGCLLELSAEGRVQNIQATCPQQGCATSLQQCTRNLVIEKTVAELPITCPFCQKMMPRHELFNHKKECHKSHLELGTVDFVLVAGRQAASVTSSKRPSWARYPGLIISATIAAVWSQCWPI